MSEVSLRVRKRWNLNERDGEEEGESKSKIGEIESMEWIMQSTQWIAVKSSYGMWFKQNETVNIRRNNVL